MKISYRHSDGEFLYIGGLDLQCRLIVGNLYVYNETS